MVAAVLALCVLAACGAARGTGTPAAAGVWRELSSEHFVVWTNTSAERARELVRVMENLRQVVIGVSFFKKELPGKSLVIAFNDVEEVHQYVPSQFIAHAWSGHNVLLQPVVVLAASSLDDDERIVTHELTHVIAFNEIRSQPAWFSEGLAGYFETVRLDKNRAKIDVGVPIEGRIAQLRGAGFTPISDLFACETSACKDDRFYATTWALFTYLLTEHSALLMHYMQRLAETPADQQPQLWAQVFPGLPPEKLDHELKTWLHYGRIRVMKYDIALRDWSVNERLISDADVLAAKGTLRYLFAPEHGASLEIERSLSLDPTHVIANMIKAVARKSIAPELARQITDAHPDDWRSWWLAWRAAQNAADANAAREKTCTLLQANRAAVAIEQCARDATGGFAEDPRRAVFMSATRQINECVVKSSKPTDLGQAMSVEIDIDTRGNVLAARVKIGTQATNVCVEQVLKALAFPKDRPGTFKMTSRPPAANTAR